MENIVSIEVFNACIKKIFAYINILKNNIINYFAAK